MSKKWNELTIALAGVFQAAALVEQLAKTGYIPQDAFRCSIESLLEQNPSTTESVFGGIEQLQLGFKVLSDLLHHHRNREYPDSLRYVLGILHLQKKLKNNKDVLNIVGNRIKQAGDQAQHFSPTHDNVIANLASVYTDTISSFRFRIQVVGDINFLQQQRIANQIRALLFAGIRAATLWRQLGGNRLQLLLSRKQLSAEADSLLQDAVNKARG